MTRRELLAIVMFLKKFRHYLGGSCVKVRTDHGSLRWLCNFKNPEGQLARWLEVLASFHVELEYRPGKRHQNADGLSRRPCKQCGRMEAKNAEREMEEGKIEREAIRHPQVCEVGCQTGLVAAAVATHDLVEHRDTEVVMSRMIWVVGEPGEAAEGELTEGESKGEVQVWLEALLEFQMEETPNDMEEMAAEVDLYLQGIREEVMLMSCGDDSHTPGSVVRSNVVTDELGEDSTDWEGGNETGIVMTRSIGTAPEITFAKIREEQLLDDTIAPILKMKEEGREKPPWEEVSP